MSYERLLPVGSPLTYSCMSSPLLVTVTAVAKNNLLIDSPGWTHTGLTGAGKIDKPPGAWTAQETVLYMVCNIYSPSQLRPNIALPNYSLP